jgi:hypothetical protein
MPFEKYPGHESAPVSDPYRNAELLMQCEAVNDRDTAYNTKGEELAREIEIARCMFCTKLGPNLEAPWGTVTVPDLQEWYYWHGEEINGEEARRQIEARGEMRHTDDHDVTEKVGVASRSIDVYAPRKYPYYAGMIWRVYDICKLSIAETADRYWIDPARVKEIFEDPEWFVKSDRYDYSDRYITITPDGERYSRKKGYYDQTMRVCMERLPQADLQPGDLL